MKKSYRGLFLLLLGFFLASCSNNPETLVTGGYNEKEMDQAISRAQNEVETFIAVLQSGEADTFSVKAPISEDGKLNIFGSQTWFIRTGCLSVK